MARENGFELQQMCKQIEAFSKLQLVNKNRAARDESDFPWSIWKEAGNLGLLSLAISPEFGGCGLDFVDVTEVLEAFGTFCLDNGFSYSVVAQMVGFSLPIARFGSEKQKSFFLPGAAKGEIVGCQAITEDGAGSDVFAMKCTAVRTSKGFLLNGSKVFISNAPIADYAIVFTITDSASRSVGGATAFIVDLRLPGVSKGRPVSKVGLQSSQLGELHFNNVEVSEDAVLGAVGGGLFVFMHSMNLERVLFFALHCGTIKRLLNGAIEHAKNRVQFGLPIGKNQAISHKIADTYVDLECGRLLVRKAAEKLSTNPTGLCVEASSAKLFVSEAYIRAGLTCLQIHGAYGFLSESGIEGELRDSLGSTIYAGTSEMQRNTIAKSLGL